MEELVDHGRCPAIGLSDIGLNDLRPLYESARIRAGGGAGRSTSVSSGSGAAGEFCKEHGIVFLAFAPLGHGIRPGPLEDPVISGIAAANGTATRTSTAWPGRCSEVALCLPRPRRPPARANFDISALPADAFDEIDRIETRQRFNEVVKTGSPGVHPARQATMKREPRPEAADAGREKP